MGRQKMHTRGTDKILIPHKSWSCGMAEGIPVPERGVPVFEANLKLDQEYKIGKTPYGHERCICDSGEHVVGQEN